MAFWVSKLLKLNGHSKIFTICKRMRKMLEWFFQCERERECVIIWTRPLGSPSSQKEEPQRRGKSHGLRKIHWSTPLCFCFSWLKITMSTCFPLKSCSQDCHYNSFACLCNHELRGSQIPQPQWTIKFVPRSRDCRKIFGKANSD